jgi:protein-S-isoprenylcysteine O-methyltransferase Ste14
MRGKVLPPIYVLIALAFMVALHFLVPVYQYWSLPLTLTGVVPIVLGVFLNVTADRQFKRHETTVKPFQQSSALLTAFPFSISRNPMYLGLTLLLFGIALLLGTVAALLPALVFPYIIDRIFIRTEEKMLAETFGREWEEYQSKVRRWI